MSMMAAVAVEVVAAVVLVAVLFHRPLREAYREWQGGRKKDTDSDENDPGEL